MDENFEKLLNKMRELDTEKENEENLNELEQIVNTLSLGLEKKDEENSKLKEENTKLKDRVWSLYESQTSKKSKSKKSPDDDEDDEDDEDWKVDPAKFIVRE